MSWDFWPIPKMPAKLRRSLAVEKKPTRQSVEAWCKKNLRLVDGRINLYEHHVFNSNDHNCVRMRVMLHDFGGWLSLGSCYASYAGDEEQWKFINLGDIPSLKQLDALLSWVTKYKKDYGRCETRHH